MLVPVSRINAPAITMAKGSPSRRLARVRISIYVSMIYNIYSLSAIVPGLLLSLLVVFLDDRPLLCRSSRIELWESSLWTGKGSPSSVSSWSREVIRMELWSALGKNSPMSYLSPIVLLKGEYWSMLSKMISQRELPCNASHRNICLARCSTSPSSVASLS